MPSDRQIRCCSAPYLTYDGVVRGGHGVEDPVDAIQTLLVLRRHAVELLVVELQGSTLLPAQGDVQSNSNTFFILQRTHAMQRGSSVQAGVRSRWLVLGLDLARRVEQFL